MNKGFNYLNQLFIIVYYFSKLNLLFLIFLLLGLGVLGVFPSLSALIKIVIKKDYAESVISIRKHYPIYYKKYFIRSNIVGWSMTLIGILLYFNFNLLVTNSYTLEPVILITFITVTSLFLSMLVWIFPVMLTTNDPFMFLVKQSFVIGVLKIHISIIVLIAAYFIVIVSLIYPALILFFSISIFSYVWAIITTSKLPFSKVVLAK